MTTVFLPHYLSTYLSVFLPLLTAPLICHSNTKQLCNYATTEHHKLEIEISNVRECATEDIWNISRCVPLRINATCKDVRHRGCTHQDVCHWGYMKHIKMCATEYIYATYQNVHQGGCTHQNVCHWGYMKHIRTCATEDICNMLGCVPWMIHAAYQDVCHWRCHSSCCKNIPYAKSHQKHINKHKL
jgi:hypothetical protein